MPSAIDPLSAPYHRPVIPITLSLAAGAVLAYHMPAGGLTALFILAGSILWLFGCLRRERPARWTPLLACMAAGYLSLMPWLSPHHLPDHVVHYLDSGYWRIRGTVIDPPASRFGRTRLLLEVDSLSRKQTAHAVRGRIRLTVMEMIELEPGDSVVFSAKIRSFSNFKNPGGFDYRRHMALQGIVGSSWVPAEKIRRDGRGRRFWTTDPVHRVRQRLSSLIDEAGSGGETDEKAVLKALVYGDRSGIDDDLRERFNRAGAGHLLAISGLHVGIVASVVFAVLSWILSFVPPLLWRGWGRRWAAAATLAAVMGYGVLAGMTPSTQRAEIMVAMFLVALILGRAHDTLNTLALAALTIVVLIPPALFSISFQLSFAAVLAIVYGLEKIGGHRERSDRPAIRAAAWLKGFTLVSALAIAGTTPVVLFYFNQTSLVGMAANLILVPIVGFVAVPVGLVSAAAALVFEPASALMFALSIKILHLALMAVDFFAGLPFAAFKTVTPSLLEIVLYYLIGWALLNLKRTTPVFLILAAALATAAGDGLYWSYQRFWRPDLTVTAIDVGQGTSTLMELPGGEVLLLDGGGFSDNRFFDMGQRVVAPMLWRKKIATVDILVLSHPNADHLNGLIYIARHFNVRELWTNGDANTTKGYRDLMAVCREQSIAVRRMDADSRSFTRGTVTLAVLHPAPGFLANPEEIDQESRNNGSLVVRAAFGQTAFLVTGDIMDQAERELVGRAVDALPSTVLFAPHHGSRSSSSPELIAAVKPDIVAISAGAANRFGFPHADVLDRYRAAGCRILCTATHGAISMRSDGSTVTVGTFSHPRR